MFKKTLLALTVAGLSSAATAGTIYSSTADGDGTLLAAVAAIAGQGAIAGFAGDENCDAIATELGLTLINTNGEGGADDTATDGSAAVDTFTTGSVTMTGPDACAVIFPTQASSTPISSSIEAAQNVSVPADATLVSGIGGYDVGDTITIQISGALIDKTATEALIPSLVDQAGTAVASVLDVEPGAVRFTVGTANSAARAIFALTNIVLDATGLSASSEVTYNAFATNTSGTNFDVSTGAVVADLVPQYSATVTTALDGIVDVSQDRQSLAVNSDDNKSSELVDDDTLVVAVSLDATGTVITPSTVNYAISGNFAWLDALANTSDDGVAATAAEVLAQLNAGTTFYTGTGDDSLTSATLNADLNVLTVVTAAASGDVDTASNFVFEVPGAGTTSPVLSESDYSVSVTVNDATASPNTIAMSAGSAAAGAWTLNGSVVTVPYMPFDDNTAVIMRHTNTGVQSGDVSVRYMLEGVSTNWETAGVVASTSRGVINIRDAVINAIKAAAGVTSGKVAIEITTNVPADDVTVYAAFKVKDEQDRGFVGTFGHHGSANN